MATSTKFANANTVVTTGWTDAGNAYADDGSYATAAPAKNSSIVTDYGTAAFTSGDIPDNSVINSVTIEAQYKSNVTNSTNATFGVRLNDNGSLHTESTYGMATTDQIATRASSAAVTLANLRIANTVKARVTGLRANSNNAITWSCDYVKLTVDYTAPVNGTATPSGVSSTSSLGTAVAGVSIAGTPAGIASTSSLGSTIQSGDATKAATGSSSTGNAGVATTIADASNGALGNACTGEAGVVSGSGTGAVDTVGLESLSNLGIVIAEGTGGEPEPPPEPPQPSSGGVFSGANWVEYYRVHRRITPIARPLPVPPSITALGIVRAHGTAQAAVTGGQMRLTALHRAMRATGSARLAVVPLPICRLQYNQPRAGVNVVAVPVRNNPNIRLTDEELAALVMLID